MNYGTPSVGLLDPEIRDLTNVVVSPSRCFKIKRGTQHELAGWIGSRWSGARAIYEKTAEIHHSMPPWQCMLLAGIGSWFNYEGARILEIGGCKGGSAAIWAEAAPQAEIHTIEPAQRFQAILAKNLAPYQNVRVWQRFSWQLFEETADEIPQWDLIFVDGNHVLVHKDLPWWNRLKPGGLMFFDDYTPRIYPVVCAAVRDLWESIGREAADIVVARRHRAGMVGVWKRSAAEVWPDTSRLEI